MDALLLAAALACAGVNALGVVGGRDALRHARPGDRETRATAGYLIARCVALTVAALIGAAAVALSWPGETTGWILALTAVTVLVQLLDIPIWLSRSRPGYAAAAGSLAAAVAVLAVLVLVR